MTFAGVLKAFDLLMLAGDAVTRLKGRLEDKSALAETAATSGAGGPLETRLASVVVAALKEAFERDHSRLEFEREQFEAARRRAEHAQRLELRRQAIDREVARLRLLAGAALAGWIASVVLLTLRLGAISTPSRTAVAVGWLLLLASLAATFSAQRRVGGDVSDDTRAPGHGAGSVAAMWLFVLGLAATAVSLLL